MVTTNRNILWPNFNTRNGSYGQDYGKETGNDYSSVLVKLLYLLYVSRQNNYSEENKYQLEREERGGGSDKGKDPAAISQYVGTGIAECGPAALASVLTSLGKGIGKAIKNGFNNFAKAFSKLRKEGGAPLDGNTGTTGEELAKAARAEGANANAVNDGVDSDTGKNKKEMVLIPNGKDKNGETIWHWVVNEGFNKDGTVSVRDPKTGRINVMSADRLKQLNAQAGNETVEIA